jgi:hypothetical protein
MLGNVALGRTRLFGGWHLDRFRHALADVRENQPVIAPEALPTADGLQKEQWQ